MRWYSEVTEVVRGRVASHPISLASSREGRIRLQTPRRRAAYKRQKKMKVFRISK